MRQAPTHRSGLLDMARALDEWIGTSDDQRAPKRVRDRIRDNHPNCYICTKPFVGGDRVALDHVVALINGGANAESNLRPVHIKCHAEKTAADVAEKARIAAKRQAHRGIVKDGPKMKGQDFAMTQSRAAKLDKRIPKQPVANQSHIFRMWQAGQATGD